MELKLIEELAGVMARTALAELEYTKDGTRIRLQRGSAVPHAAGIQGGEKRDSITSISASPSSAAPSSSAHTSVPLHTVVAGMRGTFYGAPSPGESPFAKVGDLVQEGQVLAVVEAMKMLNQIESDVVGRIVRIAVQDGAAVMPTTVLFEIDPNGGALD